MNNKNFHVISASSMQMIQKLLQPSDYGKIINHDMSFHFFKRVVSERHRDKFRGSLKKGTEKSFLSKYKDIGWDSNSYNKIKFSLKETIKPQIDHRIPLNFWASYRNSALLKYCNHPDNILITSAKYNMGKGSNIPDFDTNNMSIIHIADAIKVKPSDLKHSLELYQANHPDFYKDFSEEDTIGITLRSENKNYNFSDLI